MVSFLNGTFLSLFFFFFFFKLFTQGITQGRTELEEIELDHLDGHKGSRPVRIGNGAADHVQLVRGSIFSRSFCGV